MAGETHQDTLARLYVGGPRDGHHRPIRWNAFPFGVDGFLLLFSLDGNGMREWKCGTRSCNAVATSYAEWPGQPLPFCPTCCARAESIADGLGFRLAVVPLNAWIAARLEDLQVKEAEQRLTSHKST